MTTEVDVLCVGCGSAVRRPAAVARVGSWRSTVRCPACATATELTAKLERARHHADQRRAQWVARVRAFDAGAQYESATITDFDGPVFRSAITGVVDHHQAAARTDPLRSGVLLIGPSGIGKTRAMFAILNLLATSASRVEFGSEDEILGASKPSWEMAGHIAERVGRADVIGIDDVGVSVRRPDERMVAWKVFADVVARECNPVLVVMTTNLRGWRPLEDWVGAQAASRLSTWMPLATPGYLDWRTGQAHESWKHDLERAQQAGAQP